MFFPFFIHCGFNGEQFFSVAEWNIASIKTSKIWFRSENFILNGGVLKGYMMLEVVKQSVLKRYHSKDRKF